MAEQMTADELRKLSQAGDHEAIVRARAEGRLDTIMGMPAEDVRVLERGRTGTLKADDLKHLRKLRREDLIVRARAEGRIAGMAEPDGQSS